MNSEAKASIRKKNTYQPHFPQQAHKLCLLGATDKDLTSFFGICKSTLSNWKKQHADFNLAILNGKKAADMEVAASLYQATLDKIITTKQAIKCKEVYYDENGNQAAEFADEIEKLDDTVFFHDFTDSKYGNYFRNLHGIIEHTHYHLGQIAIIKKLVTG